MVTWERNESGFIVLVNGLPVGFFITAPKNEEVFNNWIAFHPDCEEAIREAVKEVWGLEYA